MELSKRFDPLLRRAPWFDQPSHSSAPRARAPEESGPVTRTPAQQAEALLARLTTAEKIAFLHQHQPAVPRLGLAAFHTGCEALHGVAWLGTATVFPQAVGLGATWDRDLLRRIGAAVSTEVRAFRQDTANAVQGSGVHEKPSMVSLNVWAPVVNLLRDPRWGRNEEGYSEDPFATAQLAAAYCRGLRGDHPAVWRTAPVLKHFLAYNTETDRDLVDIRLSDRDLHEYELPAFRGPIEAGVVAGVMPGYNLTNGIPNHVHPLLRAALRAWDPDLAVCSDAQAPSNLVEREKYFDTHPESHAAALKAGVDSFTDNGADPEPTVERFTAALDQGLVTEADIDAAVGRILLLRARTGEFAPEDDPYAGIRADVIDCPAHRELAREAAEASVVLLKNEAGALPLTAPAHSTDSTGSEAPSLAVIGHLGSRVLSDWYSATLPYAISIADGLAAELGTAPGSSDRLTVVDGADLVMLRAQGQRQGHGQGAVGARPVEFGPFRHQDWGTSVQCPLPVHTLQSLENGRYLTLTGPDDTDIEAAAAMPDGWFVKELWEFERAGSENSENGDGTSVLLRSNSPKSRKYVRIEPETGRLLADADEPAAATRFRIDIVASGEDEATAAAAGADRAILVLGNDPHINGRETIDRDGLALPARQERLLRAVVAANPETVLILVSSYPYAIDWAARHVPAILWTSHGGQELGTAVARVLTGRHNPSARLPQTWYAASAELPDRDDYDIAGSGWTYQYSRREHLYPFGHGLSYAAYEYGSPVASLRDDGAGAFTVTVECQVTNTGAVAGSEIAQLYARRTGPAGPGTGSDRAPRRLAGFERIELAPGEKAAVAFEVPAGRLARWAEGPDGGALAVLPGSYEFAVGRSSADLPLLVDLELP
jgi:beta-glucosidase